MEDTQPLSDGDFSPECSKLHVKRSNSPVPSCVSMMSDESMEIPLKFAARQTSPELSRFQKERSNSPEHSYVSMKSGESMDIPLKFAGRHKSTDPSRFQKERLNQPEPSSVSMKSDESMDVPLKFAGRYKPTDPSRFQKERLNQPEPSNVSMKSGESMDVPLKFAGRHKSTDLSQFQKERSNQPEPSSVSMKSGESMDVPLKFAGRHKSTDPSRFQKERSNQPEPSSVSMKSGESMDVPLKFAGRHKSTDLSQSQKEQLNKPEPSCVSVKSGESMDVPLKFAGRHASADPSQFQREQLKEPEPSCVSMKSDESMGIPLKFAGKRTTTDQREMSNQREQSCRSMEEDGSRSMLVTYKGESNLSGDKFKFSLLMKFECLYEGTAKQGNPTLLNEIYTELYITESESGEISNEHEVRQIETQSRRAAKEDKPIKCKDIFRLLPGQDKAIRTVLTKGVAGIGKTVSVQKFIVDWAERKHNQDVQLIFPLSFRELNLMKDKKFCLLDLLHIFFPETKNIKPFTGEYKIAFIFDGLDECRLSLDFQSHEKLYSTSESASADMLLTNLIVGNLLPSALIWITSRPAAADLIPSEFVHRVTEVRGFNEPQKEEYFRKRISDQSLANTVIRHLKSSRSLHIMCHIPVFCWISATVLEKMLSEEESREIPKTLTQMYTHFLIIQTNIKHEKDYEKKVKDEDMILKLGKLAFEQLVKGNLIFYEEDLRECGIDETEASVYSGLCTQIFREEFGLFQGKVFCFVHLSIQEHLAGLYAHLSFTKNYINVFDRTEQSLFSKVLTQKKKKILSGLHQRAVDEALQSKNGHLDLFLRFLLGLSLEFNQTLLQEILTQIENCFYNKEETVKFIKEKIRENPSPERSINLFHCLNELGDDSLMQEIQGYLGFGKMSEAKLSSSQWSAVVYVLLTSEKEMDVFELQKFIGTQNTADEVLQKLLPVVKESRCALLNNCCVRDEGCAALASALRSKSSHLRIVDLNYNNIGDTGVNLLSGGLKDPHCKLENLLLMDCGITDKGCAALASALSSNPSRLTELNLSENKIGDSGLKLLSEGLKDCKLEALWLWDCGATDEGCAALVLALRSNPSHLRQLYFSRNKLGQLAVDLFSDLLKNPHCKLETLCSVQQSSNPPELSCVSMKSEWSMTEPVQLQEKDTSTDLSHRQSSNPPQLSCVSMKSKWSMTEPIQLQEKDTSTDLGHRQSSNPPQLSCVSMKSKWSMTEPVQLQEKDTSTDLSHRQSSNPPEPSCVSMKSKWSMTEPVQLQEKDTSTDLGHRQSSNPPEPSCVSMKSKWSMTEPVQLQEKDTDLSCRFKSNLLKKFQCLYEGTAKQGNPTLLKEIYTELYITESESGEISNEHEVRQIETQSRRAATENTPIKCKDIFRLLPGQEKAIRTVLTKGVAGIGKTVSVQKFIVDWAEGKENQAVQLIFPLSFRELNLMKGKTLSLSDLLHVFIPETKEMNPFKSEYKVVFIFDGLDECRLSLDFQSHDKLYSTSESASVDVLLTNLIVGNLLPFALIWITSRPAAANLIPSECVHRVTEVRGFNEPQKEEYFRKRISDQSLADRIITHLKSSRSLHIMCHIPVFCWISANVLEKMLSEEESREIPKTLTQMYTHFLIIQTNIKHEKDYEKKVKDEDMIVKLGKLAFEQLLKGNLIFYEEDLRECGIDETEASVYSGLCTQIFREEFGLNQRKVFCFIHLSIQEHLAALYAHLSIIKNNMNVFDQTKQSIFSIFLRGISLYGLHQKAVDNALQSKNGHLDLFLRFLLGLSLESNQTLLRELLTQTGICSYSKEKTAQYIKQKIRVNCSPERSINLFHCLNELGDDSLMQEIQDYLKSGKTRETKLSSSQWSALVYVLLTSEQKMEVFDLKRFIGVQNTADEFLQKLLPVVKESRSVQLDNCGVTDEGCAALASALRSNPSHLRELDLSGNKLGASVVNLFSVLKDPQCKLEILKLWYCGVTYKGCAALALALISNPSHLRQLDLSGNRLRSSTMNLLSDLLKDLRSPARWQKFKEGMAW
ncbi:hypothetical protein QQF64_013033, partial [Cirrhinus molitorella]